METKTRPPTVRQIYALARELCERMGAAAPLAAPLSGGLALPGLRLKRRAEFLVIKRDAGRLPESFEGASETIERLRIENGHPAPRLEDTPTPSRERRRRTRAAPTQS